jgi:cyclopropane fatty-acyl-phospholipid synthase-like methyltransferase
MNATDPRNIVREGYDRVSLAYRADDFPLEGTHYGQWLPRFTVLLPRGGRVLDLGCGCGVPVARALAREFRVMGIDLSPVQVERARRLVPDASFAVGDMVEWRIAPANWDGIVAFFALIHVPLEQQPGLIRRLAAGLVPGGALLATVGHEAWTGTEDDWRGVPGATMYWSHADVATYREWFGDAGLDVIEEGFKAEGDGGHSVLLARRAARGGGEAPRRED